MRRQSQPWTWLVVAIAGWIQRDQQAPSLERESYIIQELRRSQAPGRGKAMDYAVLKDTILKLKKQIIRTEAGDAQLSETDTRTWSRT